MAERTVLVRLRANVDAFKADMEQATRAVEGVGKRTEQSEKQATTALGRMAQSSQKNRAAWDDAGMALGAFGAVAVAGLGAAVKAAVDWESAWAGVTKTVDGSASEMAALEGELRGLARSLPATHGEIAAVAEAAGQLGVKRQDIAAFTKTMVDLGETTNLSADEAATSLAQMMNVMQTAPADVGRLGASLVALGNAGASTEKDILNMASYITGSARLIGASESDVLALANAMTSMGINAERGGGVMTRVMQDVYTAVQTGGDKLEGFADVAGMSSEEFARAFEEDPIRAIDAFVQGLNGVEKSGGNVVATLADLGYKGTQDTAVLLQLKGAGDLLTESLDLGNKAWQENTALVEEAEKRYGTTAARLAMARNGIVDAAISIGDTFLPMLASLAEGIASVAGWFAGLPEPLQVAIGGLTGVMGVAGLAGGAFLMLVPRVVETVTAFRTLNAAHPEVTSGMGKVAKAVGVAGAAFVAFQMISSAFSESTDQLSMFASKAQALGGPDVTGQIAALTDEVARQQAIVDEAAISWQFWGGGIFSNDEAKTAADRIDALNGRLAQLKSQKELDAIASQQAEQAAQGMATGTAAIGTAVSASAPTLAGAYASLEAYAAALGMSEDATEELRKKTEDLGASLADFVDPLAVYTGMLDEKAASEEEAARRAAEAAGASTESWQDFVTDTGFAFDTYMQRLMDQVTAQENWQVNMLRLSGRVSQGTLEQLTEMGVKGAGLVAELVTKSDAELDTFDDLAWRRSKEASDAWGAQLTLAQPVLAEIGKKAGQGVVDELSAKLQAGTTTVAAIATQYGVGLANGINPILGALGKKAINVNPGMVGVMADGGLVDFYANGGVENHVAQIAPAGAWRVWAEEETGGEAYIPLSPAKRDRSTQIWREVGKRLGVETQEFAFGGINDVPRPSSTAPYRPPISTAGDSTMQKAYDELTAWLLANQEPPGAAGGSANGLLPIMAAARQYVSETYGVRNIGGYANRNIAGTNVKSDHALGKAIDVMTSNKPLGWSIANDLAFGEARRRFNIENVIWQQSISSRGGPFKRMADRGSVTQNHYDHIHADTFAKGGILNPHIRDAGGPLLPGYTFNGTGAPETVVSNRRFVDAGIGRDYAAAPVNVNIRGAQIVGTLDLGGGLEARIDGRIVSALTGATSRGSYNP